MGIIYGYVRVSTDEQKVFLQEDALKKYGCDVIVVEKESGRKEKRKALSNLMRRIKPGDTLVIWKLDRLARTTKQLITLSSKLQEKQVTLVSLQENLNTDTPLGRFYFTIIAAISEMEVEMIRERTRAGIASAKRRGKTLGRPNISPKLVRKIQLLSKQGHSVIEIARRCEVSRNTVYKYMAEEKKQPS
ncbi:recombinase family protein [Listeria kieliensis]|uniref:recombinase family protein n=1 Tax=Listeria kieliensis TaxID=1621700 RepID=UPI000F092DC3|nr:recombinase family protein [Listeria kieliensis]